MFTVTVVCNTFRMMFVFGRIFMYVHEPFVALVLMYLEYLSRVKCKEN
jgi:hypothetical protein